MIAGSTEINRLRSLLFDRGFIVDAEYGGEQPSGPDLTRFVSQNPKVIFEFQAAKTELQESVVHRASTDDRGVRVATAEDLIVLKLIANRSKDQIDLDQLCKLPDLDWEYIERWATEWELSELIAQFRDA